MVTFLKVFLVAMFSYKVIECMQCQAWKLSTTTTTTTALEVLAILLTPNRPPRLWECEMQEDIMCPEKYPWAFDYGKRCCAFSERTYGGPLLKESSADTCLEFVECKDQNQKPRICTNFRGNIQHYYNIRRHEVLPRDYNKQACPLDLEEESPHKKRKISGSELRRLTLSGSYLRKYQPGQKIRISHSMVRRLLSKKGKLHGRRLVGGDDCLNNDHCNAHSTGHHKFFWIHLEHTHLDNGVDLPGPNVANWLKWAATKKTQHGYCAQNGQTVEPFVGAHVLYYDTNSCEYKIGILKTSKTCNSKAKGGIKFGGSASLGCAIHCAGVLGSDVQWAKNFRTNLIKQYKKATEAGFGYASNGFSGGAYWKCDTIVERLDLGAHGNDIDNFANQFVGPDYWTQKGSFPGKAKEICETELGLC